MLCFCSGSKCGGFSSYSVAKSSENGFESSAYDVAPAIKYHILILASPFFNRDSSILVFSIKSSSLTLHFHSHRFPDPSAGARFFFHRRNSRFLLLKSQETMEIEAGSFYQLNHSKLPTDAPAPLSSIRAAMVSEKTEDEVVIIFPSDTSLRTFFGEGAPNGLMQPNLDEKLAIGVDLAESLFINQISFEEFASQRASRNFWMFPSDAEVESNKEKVVSPNFEMSSCFDDRIGLVKWGTKKRARSNGKQRASRDTSLVDHEIVLEESEQKVEARKRKCRMNVAKSEKKNSTVTKYVNPQNRWTEQRYKLAEKNLLEIMKSKGAYLGNPILRPDLRTAARKLIGDTGLLDHLLKHMAGKLAPGGEERFRRRHNPEGHMEYWLEGADLVDIRKKAGIDDPYWTPPPGWKPGDSPTQDPVCARELAKLKEEVANMKRKMEDMAKKQRKNQFHVKGSKEKDACVDLNTGMCTYMPLKGMYDELMKRKNKIEEQLLAVAKNMNEMEDLSNLLLGTNSKTVAANVSNEAENFVNDKNKMEKASSTVTEDRTATSASKKQRPKSGFRTCKPEGTFLWPNMAAASSISQVVVPVEDLLMVKSPSSASSSTKSTQLLSADYHHKPVPLRPLAERPHITPTASAARGAEMKRNFANLSVSNSTFVLDLNEIPADVVTKTRTPRSPCTPASTKSKSYPSASSKSISLFSPEMSKSGYLNSTPQASLSSCPHQGSLVPPGFYTPPTTNVTRFLVPPPYWQGLYGLQGSNQTSQSSELSPKAPSAVGSTTLNRQSSGLSGNSSSSIMSVNLAPPGTPQALSDVYTQLDANSAAPSLESKGETVKPTSTTSMSNEISASVVTNINISTAITNV